MILYIQGGRKLVNSMMRINMDVLHMLQVYIFWTICLIGITTGEYATGKFGVLMPQVRPHRPELYLCTPVKVDYTNDYYIVGFQPNASMNVAHHMLMYGCGEPGSTQPVWNCGEMAKTDNSEEEFASTCRPGSHSAIIYAWARDAPTLRLPDGVGFKVGKDSPIKYIVLQVHYAVVDKFKDGSTDDSGVFLHYTLQPMYKQAGVLLLASGGEIPARQTENMDIACQITEDKILHPFAYRTHTHSLGKVVAGYKVRRDETGRDKWTQLGKRDPLTPQMFYPIDNNGTIEKGDYLAARCTMKNTRDRVTHIGSTNEDEMCNFYLMYYVDGDEPLNKACGSSGPPNYYWRNEEVGFNNIPEIEASRL